MYDTIHTFLKHKDNGTSLPLGVTSPYLFDNDIELDRQKVNAEQLRGKTKENEPKYYLEHELRRGGYTLQILRSPLFHLDSKGRKGASPDDNPKPCKKPRMNRQESIQGVSYNNGKEEIEESEGLEFSYHQDVLNV
jgi:hypothetical protein